MKRRAFLKQGGIAAGIMLLPSFVKAAVAGNRRRVIFVHLQGGNDGLNTVIPYGDDRYYNWRPTLAVPKDQQLRINEKWAFHPGLQSLVPLYEKQQMRVMHQVGFSGTEHSHYHAARIWQTGCLEGQACNHWLPEDVTIQDYTTLEYSEALQRTAKDISDGVSANIFYTALDGFDTHQFQRVHHDRLLTEFSEGIAGLVGTLKASGQFQQTLIVAWSEFGRSVKENIRKGTDHGGAGQLYIFGANLQQAGIADIKECYWQEEPGIQHDFRGIYAGIAGWMGVSSRLAKVGDLTTERLV
ncbi:uncharacterized protein DUF1501 [Chitinophaga dinghuensis]|uniref:Uncharacterized protein DUF1501 n=1 Tax=Chitinophaga dinghuensis TaxID=1539050 RepID=A0A327W7K5_9BACT|nr:DUF1501 domain-containing protein [Chitinophaga dinghuensis]RAJ86000.1 uncharacterized protein DUF1501 [Chitinophaga dinghuensis]